MRLNDWLKEGSPLEQNRMLLGSKVHSKLSRISICPLVKLEYKGDLLETIGLITFTLLETNTKFWVALGEKNYLAHNSEMMKPKISREM